MLNNRDITSQSTSALHQLAVIAVLIALLMAGAGVSLSERWGLFGASSQVETLRAPPVDLLPENTTVSDPAELIPLSRDDAAARNAAIPQSAAPLQYAGAFSTQMMTGTDYGRSLDCLTAAVHFEAATEPLEGQRAVAQVVLNRVRHPAFPNTVCGVVFQGATRRTGCQFSFACDGSLARVPGAASWARARAIAASALGGYVVTAVGLATHYHADYVLPYWSPKLLKLATIGRHIFLRWHGDWGQSGAFRDPYLGHEPAIPWRGGFTPIDPLPADARGFATNPRAAEGAPAFALGEDRPPLMSGGPAPGAPSRGRPDDVRIEQRFVVGADGKRLDLDAGASRQVQAAAEGP